MLYNLYVVIQANLDFQQASNVKIPNNTVLNSDMLFTAVLKFLIRFPLYEEIIFEYGVPKYRM